MIKVKLNEARIRSCAGVRFLPGINYIDPAKWQQVEKNPIAISWIKKGIIEPVAQPEEAAPTARGLVADMPDLYDMARLRELAEDSRKTVADAANKQIERINAMAAEDSE
jgi:hypothetical protein